MNSCENIMGAYVVCIIFLLFTAICAFVQYETLCGSRHWRYSTSILCHIRNATEMKSGNNGENSLYKRVLNLWRGCDSDALWFLFCFRFWVSYARIPIASQTQILKGISHKKQRKFLQHFFLFIFHHCDVVKDIRLTTEVFFYSLPFELNILRALKIKKKYVKIFQRLEFKINIVRVVRAKFY